MYRFWQWSCVGSVMACLGCSELCLGLKNNVLESLQNDAKQELNAL